jgi:hypothetical protein
MRLTLHSFDKHYTGGYIYIGVIGVPCSHESAGVPGGGGSVQQTALIKQAVSFSLRVSVKAKAKEKRGPAQILKSTLCSDFSMVNVLGH